MKWLAFTAAIVAFLVGLGVWSVMPPAVVWEARTPFCPRCRAEVRYYARQCPECDRSLRWTSTEEECSWCLSKEDVDYLKDSYYALRVEEGEHVGLLRRFPKAYFLMMDPGDCANCAGLGTVNEGDAEVECPVCRGGEDCIACDGDRESTVGDEGAHGARLARTRAWKRASQRSELTGLPVKRSSLIDDDVEELRGYAETETLTNERDEKLLTIARSRAGLAFQAVEEARKLKSGAAD